MYLVIAAFSTLLLPPYISNTSRQFVHTSHLSAMQLRLVSNLSNVYHSCEDTRVLALKADVVLKRKLQTTGNKITGRFNALTFGGVSRRRL